MLPLLIVLNLVAMRILYHELSQIFHDTFRVSTPFCYMYFTIIGPGCNIKSGRGTTPSRGRKHPAVSCRIYLKKAGYIAKEAVIMLKKIVEFFEEYYAEFSHSEKW